MLCFSVWNFGLPPLLKGFFDRVFLPSVNFDLSADGRIAPRLLQIRKSAAITPTVAAARPAGTGLRRLIRPGARIMHLIHYHMNVSTAATRALSWQCRARHGAVLSRVARAPRVPHRASVVRRDPRSLGCAMDGAHRPLRRDPCGKHA